VGLHRLGRALGIATTWALLVPASGLAIPGPYYAAGAQPFELGHGGAVAFNPSGTLLATATSGLAAAGPGSILSVGRDGRLSPLPRGSAQLPGSNSITFSPSGQLLAVATDSRVYVFSVSGNRLTAVPGSPFAASGSTPVIESVAFSPDSRYLAAADANTGTVVMFAVAANGSLHQVAGSPFSVGGEAQWVTFSPSGRLLATANGESNSISVMSVGDDGTLKPAAVQPVASGNFNGSEYGSDPSQVLFSPSGGLLVSQNTASISVFSVAADGSLSQAPGSPRATTLETAGIAFDPAGDEMIQGELGEGIDTWRVGADGRLSQAPSYATVVRTYALAFSSTGLIASADATTKGIEILTTTPPTVAQRRQALQRAVAVSGGPQTGRWHLLANGGYNTGQEFPEDVNALQRDATGGLGPGTLRITWSVRQRSHGRTKTIVLAQAITHFTFQNLSFHGVPLTKAGRRLLKQDRKLTATATGTFTPQGGRPITDTTRRFVLPACRNAECRDLVRAA
jgi:WD40 repeat protein